MQELLSSAQLHEVDLKREVLFRKLSEVLEEHRRVITGGSDARRMKSSVIRYVASSCL